MGNFFTLELDTTGPMISLTAPQYTIPQIETEIWVRANEMIAPYQEFYIIDAFGQRYDMTFEHLGNSFRGVYNFNDVSLGICTIYARVKDEVENPSPLVSTAISIRQPAPLELSIDKMLRPVMLYMDIRQINTMAKTRDSTVALNTMPLISGAKARQIEVGIK